MPGRTNKHWGEWIRERIAFVGFRRHSDFATLVGCSRQQLGNWFSLQSPPDHMRKGFDLDLVKGLKTDRETLFTNYRSIDPESAPVVEFCAEIDPVASRRRLAALVELMPDDRLKQLADEGERLLRDSMLQVA